LRGCFEESISYAATRKIADRSVGDLGMIRSLIARMGADFEAARFLCYAACRAEDEHLPEAFSKTLTAKYYSSRAAVRAADAVQIRQCVRLPRSSPVARYCRDAKLMESSKARPRFMSSSGKDIRGPGPLAELITLNIWMRHRHVPLPKRTSRNREFNRTEFADNVTIQELIEAQVEKHRPETAVICGTTVSARRCSPTASNERPISRPLVKVERRRPDQIVIMVERSFSMIIGLLGILKAGAAYLPISPENRRRESTTC
jgi:hypothetical protein